MLKLSIPGQDPMAFRYLVMDYNGTLATDGELIPGVAPRLVKLRESLDIHIVTADTFGKARIATRDLPCTLAVLPAKDQSGAKADYIASLGTPLCVCIGNGLNDHLMLARAGLGIAVVQREGAATATLLSADMVCGRITDALDLLLHPLRLTAGLRT